MGMATLATVALADPPSFVGDFKGFYFGPALAVGRTTIGVTNQRYRQNHLMVGGLFGYGHVTLSDLYYGGEVGLSHDTFSLKQNGQRVEKNNQVEGVLRFGQLIQNNFLPYVGLGAAYSDYKMQTSTQNKEFHTTDLISEVGVDAFVRSHWVIRSSFRYQRGLSTQGSLPVDVQKKPNSFFIKIGASYIL